MNKLIYLVVLVVIFSGCNQSDKNRIIISLNGTWEFAKTESITQIPASFPAKIQVPGLVDLAETKIDSQDSAYNSSIYWYKRSFTVENLNSEVILIKINKAAYHTHVFVNGKLVGKNVYSFTPSLFNLKPFLNAKNKENELLIAVGCRNNLPDTVANGGDFEKTKYIPGIYDDVKLIVSGMPFIANVQTVPDISNGQLRVLAEIQSDKTGGNPVISYTVRETSTQKVVAKGTLNLEIKSLLEKVDFSVKIPDCQLWSPESPFLYDLELRTPDDNLKTRFGMRTFETSKDSAVFLLNGNPYFLRGTNVCIFRFFEDPSRGNLPWDSNWTTLLHRRFQEMNWNSIRYCIGFPPERWYEIADSLGILIQDEYPIWTGGKGGFENLLKGVTSKQLANEYRDWMRERWNHPCVVVWDAQNESVNDTTGKAINMVRNLDLSGRPWDNGYAAPASKTDVIESHPYLFVKYFEGQTPSKNGFLKDLLGEVRLPNNDPNDHTPMANGERYSNVVIVNEYSWLWLNRDGTPTTLTDRVFKVAFPEATTTEKRFEASARYTAILTEYWRAYRKCAGVMHFCGLGYSRSGAPRGQTSDNFIDLKNLVYEPQFYKYVKSSFSPVGLMVEMWDRTVLSGAELKVPVHVFNDTGESWQGKLKMKVMKGETVVSEQEVPLNLGKYEKMIVKRNVKMPSGVGDYELQAEILCQGETVKSIREISMKLK